MLQTINNSSPLFYFPSFLRESQKRIFRLKNEKKKKKNKTKTKTKKNGCKKIVRLLKGRKRDHFIFLQP